MANPNKFTAKEVLNKVLLDSSGNAVTANSVTSQEALNSVLDTTNNRLNMSLAGGTISGDVTISGDLTVNGSATNSYDEIVNGDLHVKSDSGNSTSAFLVEKNDGTDVLTVDTANLRVGIGASPSATLHLEDGNDTEIRFSFGSGQFLHKLKNEWTSGTASANKMRFFISDGTTTGNNEVLTLTGDKLATFSSDVKVTDYLIIDSTAGDVTKQKIQFHDDNVGLQRASGSDRTANGNSLYISAFEDIVFTASGAAMASQTERLRIADDGSATFSGDVNIDTGKTLTFTPSLFSGGVQGIKFDDGSVRDAIIQPVRLTGNAGIILFMGANSFVNTSGGVDRYSDSGPASAIEIRPDNGQIRFLTNTSSGNPVSRMAINKEGTVGIGTDDPIAGSGTKTVLTISNSTQSLLVFEDTGHESSGDGLGMFAYDDGTLTYRTASRSGTDFTGSTNRLVIDSNSIISLSNNDGGNTGNTIFGNNAWQQSSNVGADHNTIFGQEAMGSGNIGAAERNTGIGFAVMRSITTGDSNVAVGADALFSITTGSDNIGIGRGSGDALKTGEKNCLIGRNALGSAAFGETGNVAIGHESMASLNEGANASASADNNIAIGQQALLAGAFAGNDKVVNDNIAIGAFALDATADNNQTGTIAIGRDALTACTSGTLNLAIGYQALSSLTTGNSNVAIGYTAMTAVTDGVANVAFGRGALGSNTQGDCNTAIGHQALETCNPANNDGFNTAVGQNSLQALQTGVNNVALGAGSGDILTTGSGNTLIGQQADPSAVNVNDEIVLKAGLHAVAGAGTETIRIGVDSDFITNDFGTNATWTHSSDKRIKKDIKDNTLGLDFINDLRTVTFKKKAPSEYPKEFDSYNETKTKRKNPDRVNYGFIAQEVKEAMDKAGHSEFPVWKENADTMQELGEAELIIPLVKAIQELSARVKELEGK